MPAFVLTGARESCDHSSFIDISPMAAVALLYKVSTALKPSSWPTNGIA